MEFGLFGLDFGSDRKIGLDLVQIGEEVHHAGQKSLSVCLYLVEGDLRY